MNIRIAIDGPAGAGKSTIAKVLSRELNMSYIDSGSIYRAMTLRFAGLDFEKMTQKEICDILDDTSITIKDKKVYLNGKDVSREIRSEEISKRVSIIAANKNIREKIGKMLKEISKKDGIIMDGRDIGTVIMPDADFKFFITASVEERAKRRYNQLKSNGYHGEYHEVLNYIIKRDDIDSKRDTDPLRIPEDAIIIDTTDTTVEEIVEKIKGILLGG